MKAHLLTSEFPIVSGQNQTADCGKEFAKAQILFMWDGQEMGKMVLSSLLVCKDCLEAERAFEWPRYLYGITERIDEQSTDTTAQGI